MDREQAQHPFKFAGRNNCTREHYNRQSTIVHPSPQQVVVSRSTVENPKNLSAMRPVLSLLLCVLVAAVIGLRTALAGRQKLSNLDPLYVINMISEDYGIDGNRLYEALGGDSIFDNSDELSPLTTVSEVISEIIQVNSSCSHSYVCSIGTTITHNSLDAGEKRTADSITKALIIGMDDRRRGCDKRFGSPCRPELNQPYRSLVPVTAVSAKSYAKRGSL